MEDDLLLGLFSVLAKKGLSTEIKNMELDMDYDYGEGDPDDGVRAAKIHFKVEHLKIEITETDKTNVVNNYGLKEEA